MMNHMEAIIGLALGILGVVSAIVTGLGWYRAIVKKDVERERDYGHLKNNYLQMSKGLNDLYVQNDQRFDHIDRQLDRIEVKVDPGMTLPR
jgi:hypothetical protein